jgi:hypothetical protein
LKKKSIFDKYPVGSAFACEDLGSCAKAIKKCKEGQGRLPLQTTQSTPVTTKNYTKKGCPLKAALLLLGCYDIPRPVLRSLALSS